MLVGILLFILLFSRFTDPLFHE